MLNNSIFHLFGFTTLLVFFTCSMSLYAGKTGEDTIPITFHAVNEPVRQVLKRLADDHGLNLTYNASNKEFDTHINYSADNKKPETVLSDILALINHEHTSIGNQLVIHRSERFEMMTSGSAATPNDTIIRIVEVPVVVVDTVILYETRTEIVYRPQAISTPVRPLIINRPSNMPYRLRNERLSVSLSYAQMLAGYNYTGSEQTDINLQEIRDSDGHSFRNFMLSGGLHYQFGAAFISTSFSLNSYALPFNYKELFTIGGYHRVDTLDSFYTVVDGEEIWIHITDSTYIPLESRELSYDRTNYAGMFGMRLNIAYDLYISHNSSFFIHGGVQAAIPLWQRGNTILNTTGFPAIPLSRKDLNDLTYGFHFGPGVRSSFNDRLDFVLTASYQRYVKDIYKTHPLNRNLRGVSFQAGVHYYL